MRYQDKLTDSLTVNVVRENEVGGKLVEYPNGERYWFSPAGFNRQFKPAPPANRVRYNVTFEDGSELATPAAPRMDPAITSIIRFGIADGVQFAELLNLAEFWGEGNF